MHRDVITPDIAPQIDLDAVACKNILIGIIKLSAVEARKGRHDAIRFFLERDGALDFYCRFLDLDADFVRKIVADRRISLDKLFPQSMRRKKGGNTPMRSLTECPVSTLSIQ